MPTYFVTAIDTDAGKTVATGLLARHLVHAGKKVVTCKLVQTGCAGVASDIEMHRSIMGMRLLPEDLSGETCPYVFAHPASPHLSAAMEGTEIETIKLSNIISRLEAQYEYVLVEGAGGLQVPLREDYTILDFLQDRPMPVILVTNSRLGSINHSLLSLECLSHRGIELSGVIYNHFPNPDKAISSESARVIRRYGQRYFPGSSFAEIPVLNNICSIGFDFDGLLGL